MWETAPSLGGPRQSQRVLGHWSLPESPSRNGKAYEHGERLCRGCSPGRMGKELEGASSQPHSPVDRALVWVCLLEFYFALFGDRVVQVGIKLEILSSAS